MYSAMNSSCPIWTPSKDIPTLNLSDPPSDILCIELKGLLSMAYCICAYDWLYFTECTCNSGSILYDCT